MKKINLIYCMTLIILIFSAWAFVPVYLFLEQFAYMIKFDKPSLIINVNIIPILAFIIVGGFISFIIYRFDQKKKTSSIFIPQEFAEGDEREKTITAQACRKVYISLAPITGVMIIMMMLYPFIIDLIPYYPILVVFILPITQLTIYFLSIRKHEIS